MDAVWWAIENSSYRCSRCAAPTLYPYTLLFQIDLLGFSLSPQILFIVFTLLTDAALDVILQRWNRKGRGFRSFPLWLPLSGTAVSTVARGIPLLYQQASCSDQPILDATCSCNFLRCRRSCSADVACF